jgi:ribosomal protein S18 acetylase RimI-like enzyme
VTAVVTVGLLNQGHRARLEEIVRATGVFSADEVAVALELFDEASTAEMGNGKWEMGATAASEAHFPFPNSHVRSSPSDYEFLGAFDADSLLGFVCFGSTPSTDRTYDLYWIAVHPDAQRLGVGATLMSEVERILWDRRARLIVIETSARDDYAPTRRFYANRGYQETARLRDFYAPGDDRVVLTKRIGLHHPPPYE